MGYNAKFVSATSLNASFTSAPQLVVDAKLYTIQAAFTGSTCSFSAKIQTSSDAFNIAGGPVNWDDLPNSSLTFTSASSNTWNVSKAGYTWVRLVVTDNSSGTNNGNSSATIQVKGPGI